MEPQFSILEKIFITLMLGFAYGMMGYHIKKQLKQKNIRTISKLFILLESIVLMLLILVNIYLVLPDGMLKQSAIILPSLALPFLILILGLLCIFAGIWGTLKGGFLYLRITDLPPVFQGIILILVGLFIIGFEASIFKEGLCVQSNDTYCLALNTLSKIFDIFLYFEK